MHALYFNDNHTKKFSDLTNEYQPFLRTLRLKK